MTPSQPRSVPECDVALLMARRGIPEAVKLPWEQDPLGSLQRVWARIDQLLERRLELTRRELDAYIECWWCDSYPGTAPPQWPENTAAGQAVAS